MTCVLWAEMSTGVSSRGEGPESADDDASSLTRPSVTQTLGNDTGTGLRAGETSGGRGRCGGGGFPCRSALVCLPARDNRPEVSELQKGLRALGSAIWFVKNKDEGTEDPSRDPTPETVAGWEQRD